MLSQFQKKLKKIIVNHVAFASTIYDMQHYLKKSYCKN